MATLLLTDAFVSVDGNDVSADGNQVSWDFTAAPGNVTAFGDTSVNRIGGGLQDGSGQITLNQDFATGALDGILYPLLGTVVALIVRPTSAVVGVSNPQYSGSVHIDNYPPFGGSVNDTDAAQTTLSFTNAGNVTRAEA